MNQNNRFCTQQGHEQLQVKQVCTYRWCFMSRWCCQQCVNDGIHNHSMPNSNHIMDQENMLSKVKQDIQNLKKEYQGSKQFVTEFKEMEKQAIDNWISDVDNLKLKQLIQKVEGQNFIQLNDEDINKLLNINQYQYNHDGQLQLQDSMDKEQNVKQYQENINNNDLKSRIYDIQKIHSFKRDYHIYASLISRNEQYLVYIVNKLIHIYNLKTNKINITLEEKRSTSTCQFTIDSKFLFVGDWQGCVNGYFVKNGFKITYKQRIHQNCITQLMIQKQFLITASSDATIIKTNYINKNQIFKLVGHTDTITSIDYDIFKDIMISTSIDKSFKIWDCLNQSILINHNLEESSGSIQLINNKENILMCDFSGFCIFEIDYQNQKLVETYSYKDENRNLAFQQFNNDQNLLLIFSQYCYILNKDGELINKIYHSLDFKYYGQQDFLYLFQKQLLGQNFPLTISHNTILVQWDDQLIDSSAVNQQAQSLEYDAQPENIYITYKNVYFLQFKYFTLEIVHKGV